MNEGVKILLERIKTNPEEFLDNNKWVGLIHGYKQYLSEEDAKALDDAFNTLMQERFTERVMKELLAPEEDDSLGKWFTKPASGTLSAGMRVGASSNNTNTVWGNGSTQSQDYLDAQKYQMEQMKLHLDAHREALRQQEHKTLFGKLKNYLHAD